MSCTRAIKGMYHAAKTCVRIVRGDSKHFSTLMKCMRDRLLAISYCLGHIQSDVRYVICRQHDSD